jgi:hypothetical protein
MSCDCLLMLQELLVSKDGDQGGGGGYLVEAAGPLVLAAFACPAAALRWALTVLEVLANLQDWPRVRTQRVEMASRHLRTDAAAAFLMA